MIKQLDFYRVSLPNGYLWNVIFRNRFEAVDALEKEIDADDIINVDERKNGDVFYEVKNAYLPTGQFEVASVKKVIIK